MKLSVYIHGSSPFKPKETVEEYINLATQYENDGFHTLWFADHLIRTPDPNKGPIFETWSLISGLAMVTDNIRFGTLVSPITFRNIGVFAKMVSTIDHLSKGRITVGLGNGWFAREHEMFDIPFGSVGERMDLLKVYVVSLLQLWKGSDEITTNDQTVNLQNAYLNPQPIQVPHPPLLIGGGGEKRTLKWVAQYAQLSNFGGNLDQLEHKIAILKQHCLHVNRDFNTITKTTNRAAIIRDSKDELEQAITTYQNRLRELGMSVPSVETFSQNRLVGNPEAIAEQLKGLKTIGIDEVILTLNDRVSEQLAHELLQVI
ncbi:MAG: LLM class flavin-dependent oxidoreductase [Candidatus Kariarchaeaceae archaeon]|jgi:alkanesulfonate monooxygenase SsuD/methylene tetrahydromethanopterin reductase-like flavin-dependent oxidoreductase (luciferase family)